MKRTTCVCALLAGLASLLYAQTARAALPSTAVFAKNVASSKNLDNPGWSQKDNTLIQQWVPNGGTNQQWRLYYLNNGYYAISNVASGGKYLDIPNASLNDGTPLQQYHWNGGLNQQWGVTILSTSHTTAGTFYKVMIYNRNSFKYLDDPGFSTNNGTIIQQYRWTGGTNQQWVLGPY